MTPINRDFFGRRVQLVLHLPRNDDFTLGEWWEAIRPRRSRGFYPRSGLWPFFRYWALGPGELRVWTRRASDDVRRYRRSLR